MAARKKRAKTQAPSPACRRPQPPTAAHNPSLLSVFYDKGALAAAPREN